MEQGTPAFHDPSARITEDPARTSKKDSPEAHKPNVNSTDFNAINTAHLNPPLSELFEEHDPT